MSSSSRLHSLFTILIMSAVVGAVLVALPGIQAAAKVNVGVVRLDKSLQASDGAVSSDGIIPLLESIHGRHTADHHMGYLLGIAHLALSQEEKAILLLRTATEQGSPFAQYQLGQWFLRQGDLMSARAYLDESVCTSYQCANELAHALYSGGYHQDAIAVLESYLRKSPQNAAAHYQLVTMHWGSGDKEKTIYSIQNALRYDEAKNSYKYRYHEARLAYLTADFPTAGSMLIALVDEFPEEIAATYLLGLTYDQLGDLDKAEETFEKALELDPSNTSTQIGLARVYRSIEKWDQAIFQYQAAIGTVKSTSRKTIFLGELADVYDLIGDSCRAEETRNIIDEAGELSPTDLSAKVSALDSHCGS